MHSFWGDLPTWVTTLAVLFAAAQLRQSRIASKKESEREARAQADGVWAWAGSCRTEDGKASAYGVVITNSSPAPIRNVRVSLHLHGNALETELIRVLPPGEYFVERNGSNWGYPMTLEEFGATIRPYAQTERYMVHSTKFIDAVGTSWNYLSESGLQREPR